MKRQLTAFVVILCTAAAWAQAAERPLCGASYQEAVAGAPGGLAGALTQLYSFPDIQRLVASAGPGKVCASGIALGKNNYQYNKYLIVLELQPDSGKRIVTPVILQTASVQAYENIGAKPWLGFARQDLVSIVRDALSQVEWQEAPVAGPAQALDALPQLLGSKTEPVDPKSPAFLNVPDAEAGWSTYLVSRLRRIGGDNPFTAQYLLDIGALQVQESGGRVRWGRLSGFFSRYTQMEDLQFQSAPPRRASDEERLEKLRALGE